MTISELRKNVKNHLSGKLLKAMFMYALFVIFSIILVIIALIGGSYFTVANSQPLAIIAIVILVTLLTFILEYSMTVSMLKLYRNEPVGFFSFLSKENLKGKLAIKLNLYLIWKLLLPCIAYIGGFSLLIAGIVLSSSSSLPLSLIGILLILVGIVLIILKTFLYVLIVPVRHDNPEATTKEVFKISASYMKGKRFKYFLLQLSYTLILIIASIVARFALGTAQIPENVTALVSNIIYFGGAILLYPFTSFALFTYYDYTSNKNEVSDVTTVQE